VHMSLKVEDVMVKTVITLNIEATVKEAVTTMNERDIGCLVIVQNETPIGIITEKDMLKRVLLDAKNPEATKVSQIMTSPIIHGEPKMSVQDAVRLMVEKKIKKLPIFEQDRLVGLITLTDLLRSIAYLEHMFSNVQNSAVVQ
jgi:CBS domain-containing protein